MDGTLWSIVYKTITSSGGIESATVLLLLVLSILSWTVIAIKAWSLFQARKNNQKFLQLFRRADSLGSVAIALPSMDNSLLASIFSACMRAMESLQPQSPQSPAASDPRQVPLGATAIPEEMVVLEMRDAAAAELGSLEWGLSFLATVGSTSPFIGLFGTVWGIMNTFGALGSASSASLNVVAPGISAALIATAAGLGVAIPAVVACNWFQARVDGLNETAESFIERMEVIIRKNWHPTIGERPAGRITDLGSEAPAPSVNSALVESAPRRARS